MEKFNAQEYRDTTAERLKQIPKDGRKEALHDIQKDPNYWQARQETIDKRQAEIEIDNGLGILLTQKRLYHGSATANIDTFNPAEDYTMGRGLYLTAEANTAIGYGRVRAVDAENSGEARPVIYEVEISNIKLLDLRKSENVKRISLELRKKLFERLPELNQKKYPLHYGSGFLQAMEFIDKGNYGHGRIEVVAKYPLISEVFEEYVKSLGYDGVVGSEGGEGSGPMAIGKHSTYLLFDSGKARIIKEHVIE